MPHELVLTPPHLGDVLESLREGIQVIDRSYRYLYLNEAAAEHGQRPAAELIGRTMQEAYPGIDSTDMFAHLRRCMEERVTGSFENEFSYADGTSRTFELRVRPCEAGIVVLSIDVTEERKVTAQLHHAQKMEAIGRLAGSVAHDFNNLLSVILGYSSMLLSDLKPVDPLRADIEYIQLAGEKAAALTRQLLTFSRQQAVERRVVDLNDILHSSEPMLRRLLGEDIELVVSPGRNLSKVRVDPDQIDQVVMNLCVNARDAMPCGGKLTLESRNVSLDETYTATHLDVKVAAYVMLAVSDTGVGMDKETQARIFEPFFTTKEPGKGTGIGLSTVFGIVRQSGGHIWVYSELGGGTTFKIYLPRVEAGEPNVEVAREPVTLQGTETILLVEDQEEVLRVAREILSRYGYHVIGARNGGEALLSCERHPQNIHLLVTDVVMPQMSGSELAKRLLLLRPAMKVLYMSGYTDNAVVHHGILEAGAAYIQKPLVPESLARRVRQVLDGAVRYTQPPPAGSI